MTLKQKVLFRISFYHITTLVSNVIQPLRIFLSLTRVRFHDVIGQSTVPMYSYAKVLNPFPNKPWFLRVCKTSLLETLREKEKLLVTSNFSFSNSIFYPFGKLSTIFTELEIVVCKLFQFGQSEIMSFGKGLNMADLHGQISMFWTLIFQFNSIDSVM